MIRHPDGVRPEVTLDWGGWVLLHDYSLLGPGWEMTIPAGFRFDLASIPRLVWWLIAPHELSLAAPLVHDFLYLARGDSDGVVPAAKVFSRSETDRLFRDLMVSEGVPAWRKWAAWVAVRLFGWTGWGG
jgi:hypothetical protein